MPSTKLKGLMSQIPLPEGTQWAALQALFVNEINLVGMILGAEFVPTVVLSEGSLMPSFKVRRMKKSTAQQVADIREIYAQRKRQFLESMKLPSDKIALADERIEPSDRILALVSPTRALWRVYQRIENEYEMFLVPVLIYKPYYVSAHYEVMRKSTSSTVAGKDKGVQ